MSPAEALRGFLDALGVPPQRIPPDLDGQAALYRSLLAGRRVLVVLDNARDADQVRPLLPGSPGCLAVVTSRNQLTGLVAAEGAHPLTLDLLSRGRGPRAADRAGSARDRVAAEPEAVEEIVDRVRAAAAGAGRSSPPAPPTHPDFPLAALAAELRDGPRQPRRVRAAATRPPTCGRSSPGRTGTLSPDAAPAVPAARPAPRPGLRRRRPRPAWPALPARQARPLLAELTRAHLLTEHAPGRYAVPRPAARLRRRTAPHQRRPGRRAARGPAPDARPLPAHRRRRRRCCCTRTGTPIAAAAAAARASPRARSPTTSEALGLVHRRTRRCCSPPSTAAAATGSTPTPGSWPGRCWPLPGPARALARLASPSSAPRWRPRGGSATRPGRRTPTAASAAPYGRPGPVRRSAPATSSTPLTCSTRSATGPSRPTPTWTSGWMLRAAGPLRRGAAPRAAGPRSVPGRPADRPGRPARSTTSAGITPCSATTSRPSSTAGRRSPFTSSSATSDGEADTWDSLGYAHHHLGQHRQAITCYQRALDLSRRSSYRIDVAEILDHLGDAQQAAGDNEAAHQSWSQALDILDELGEPEAETVRRKLKA